MPATFDINILLVEDEIGLSTAIEECLLLEGFNIEVARDIPSALTTATGKPFDLGLVDINLPGGNGLDLIEKLRKTGAGVLVISARNELADKIKGLDLGADDYLPKPFRMSELLARIRAVLRRREPLTINRITFNNIQLELDTRQVTVAEKELNLTKSEFSLLCHFLDNAGRVLSKEALAEALLGAEAHSLVSTEFVYSHIKNLRSKLIKAGANDHINAVYGVGYRWDAV